MIQARFLAVAVGEGGICEKSHFLAAIFAEAHGEKLEELRAFASAQSGFTSRPGELCSRVAAFVGQNHADATAVLRDQSVARRVVLRDGRNRLQARDNGQGNQALREFVAAQRRLLRVARAGCNCVAHDFLRQRIGDGRNRAATTARRDLPAFFNRHENSQSALQHSGQILARRDNFAARQPFARGTSRQRQRGFLHARRLKFGDPRGVFLRRVTLRRRALRRMCQTRDDYNDETAKEAHEELR